MKICYNCFNELPDRAKTCPHCGTSADLRNGDKYPYALPCGSVLNGKYIVGRVLGQGGFGITYVGQQYDTKQLVAIKEYYPGAIATRNASYSVIPFNKDRSGEYEYGKKQFLDEAKTLSAFIGSPNIVRVYSYFQENGTAYFVMEYVRGTNLGQYVVSRGGRIPWEEAWALLMPVLDALSEVHFRNIIHRDIKPDNILITGNGSAKLIDFGAARYTYNEKSKSLTAVLTPGYAPLEQYFSRGKQGPWTDVYALAATIYFCITGKVPVESVERSVDDVLGKPSELGAAIPPYAEAALMKALAVREEDRYRSTYDFRNAVLAGKLREEEEPAQISRPTDAPMELSDTWEEIAEAGHDGTYRERYRIGDTKELDMGSEGIITMKLVAMDEDELSDGSGKAPMTWVADEQLKSKHNMNSVDTNKGGWEVSEMRAWLRGAVLPLMPEEVRDNIREVTKYSYSYDEDSDEASRDTIWIPSRREVLYADHNQDYKMEETGAAYTSSFVNDETRKRSQDGESGASWWWLRSSGINFSYNFYFVGIDGDSDFSFADIFGGVVVGFCF